MVEKKGDTQKKTSTAKKSTTKKSSSSPKKEASVKSHEKTGSTAQKKDTSTKKHTTQHKATHTKGHDTHHHEKSHHKEKDEQPSKNNTVMVVAGVVVALLAILAVGAVIFSNYYQGDNTSMSQNETSPNNGEVVATVNGEEIYTQEVAEIQNRLSQQGRNITQDEAISQAVSTTVLRQKVEDGGYLLSQEEVENQLASQLQSQGMSLEDFKSQQGEAYQNTIDEYQFQLSVQSFLEEKLRNQMSNVSEEQIQQYYELYSQQAQGEVEPLEEIRDQLVQSIQQRQMGEVRNQYVQQLVDNATVEYK